MRVTQRGRKVRSTPHRLLASFARATRSIFFCQLKIINYILVACASATCFCSRRWWASSRRSCRRAANGPARALRSITLCFNRIFNMFGSDAAREFWRMESRFAWGMTQRKWDWIMLILMLNSEFRSRSDNKQRNVCVWKRIFSRGLSSFVNRHNKSASR